MTPPVSDPFDSLSHAVTHVEAHGSRILGDQLTIAQIASPTGDEGRRAAWTAERMAPVVDEVAIDDAGNVVGIRRGRADDAPVVVCAHLDTVFEAGVPLTVREERR